MWIHNKQVKGWWKPKSSDDDKKLKHSLSYETREFLKNYSMHCYRWLVESNQSGWETLVLHFCIFSEDHIP